MSLAMVFLMLITAAELVLYLTPLLVWVVTLFSKWILPKVPGLYIFAIAAILSAVLGWVATLIQPDSSWLIQFGAGLLAVVLQNLIVQVQSFKTDLQNTKF